MTSLKMHCAVDDIIYDTLATMVDMSISIPRYVKNFDRLAPSRTLQEAKEQIGPAFFEAKLIECPKNAVELTKLMQHCDEIDHRKFKMMQETKRNKRILLHTMQSRYTFSKASTTMANNPVVRDIKLPPPGFRFHANGDPKLSLVKFDKGFRRVQSETSTIERDRLSSSCEDVVIQSINIQPPVTNDFREDRPSPTKSQCQLETESDISSDKSTCNRNTVSYQTDKNIEKEAELSENCYEKEMKEIEKLIREIDMDLSKNKINGQSTGTAREKALCFLRAHTHGEKALLLSVSEPGKFSRPNDRFPFQPGSSSFVHDRKPIRQPEPEKRRALSHSNCIACQYKLKHSSDDFHKLTEKLSKVHFKRWNFAPRGKLIECPSTSPRLGTHPSPPSSHTMSPGRKTSSASKEVRFSSLDQDPRKQKTESQNLTLPRKVKSASASWTPQPRGSLVDKSPILYNARSSCTMSSSSNSETVNPGSDLGVAAASWKHVMEEEQEDNNRKVKEFIRSLDNLIEKKPRAIFW